MTAALSAELKNLLDSPVFVNIATIQPDGSPRSPPSGSSATATTS